MSETALTGKAKELFVATVLVGRRLHVYFPLVDVGFDLVAAAPDGSAFVPVQVKYTAKRTGFNLKRSDAKRFAEVGAVLAFGSYRADEDAFYFFPAREWLAEAEAHDRTRGDDNLVVYLSKSGEWAAMYRGASGIERSFSKLLAARG
jgi:hypothetical protein